MLIFLLFFLMHTVAPDGSGGVVTEKYAFNLTMNHLSSRSVEVSWSCNGQSYDKYEVTIQTKDYKIVKTVPHNLCYVGMDNLIPNTDYRISVTSTAGGVRRRSNKIFFRTLMEDVDVPETETNNKLEEEETRSRSGLKLPNVKLVEISLVAMALVLWAGAIVLFFHRWGKIRMLLPYQPQYKEMKTNASSTCTNCSMTPHHQAVLLADSDCDDGEKISSNASNSIYTPRCSRLQQLQMSGEFGPATISTAAVGAGATSLGLVTFTDTGCSPMRPRLNSFVGFNNPQNDYPIGMRIYRKALSCDHLPLSERFWFDDTDLSDA